MDFFYSMLNNIYIIFQVIFWALIFFWLDFDLFTYILNDHLTIKTILGIILGCSHLFLFRYLFNLVDIDSILISLLAKDVIYLDQEEHIIVDIAIDVF